MFTNSGSLRRMPSGIWVLGFGSLFMDMSSELVHSLLPLYMSSVLGLSMVTIGLVEGIAEATALVTKIFSGALSDFLGRRKFLVVLGYGLSALTKPIFPLANSIGWVMVARFADRVGKGIRGAPRDALVADITPTELRGAAYGLRQAFDSIGAFMGPALAVVFMAWFANNLRATLWVGVFPALIAVALLFVGLREPDSIRPPSDKRAWFPLAGARRLESRFWLIVLLGGVFSLSRFSEAFLLLRAQSVGLAIGHVPVVLILMNIMYAALSYPAGLAADRMNKRTLLILGLVILIVADLVLAKAATAGQVFIGASLWGLHMAMTQGLLSKLVADSCPGDLRGTAFGVFNLVSGISLLIASLLAGALWDHFGAAATFLAGASFAAVTILGLLGYNRKTSKA